MTVLFVTLEFSQELQEHTKVGLYNPSAISVWHVDTTQNQMYI